MNELHNLLSWVRFHEEALAETKALSPEDIIDTFGTTEKWEDAIKGIEADLESAKSAVDYHCLCYNEEPIFDKGEIRGCLDFTCEGIDAFDRMRI